MTRPALRHGFTTGSAAAAAAKAATLLLFGRPALDRVSIPCPPPRVPDDARTVKRLDIRIQALEREPDGLACWAAVIKDGGDDPDATHGAAIHSRVALSPELEPGDIRVEGGPGVGRVTRPGLPTPVGQAAINPAPLRQIRAAVREALFEVQVANGRALVAGGLTVTVCVPDGERIAAKTMNPRLGILGGVSILGTNGTVKPFSHEAYQAAIHDAFSVARAAGLTVAACSTGRGSERLLAAACPELPALAFVQVADFYGFALRAALDAGFTDLRWGCYFGKFVKMSQGLDNTHAHVSPLDFERLAARMRAAGLDDELAAAAAQANTARQVWESLASDADKLALLTALGREAAQAARRLAQAGTRDLRLRYYVFDFGGKPLGVFGA